MVNLNGFAAFVAKAILKIIIFRINKPMQQKYSIKIWETQKNTAYVAVVFDVQENIAKALKFDVGQEVKPTLTC